MFVCYVQHHQAAQFAEGVIWYVADVVQSEGHGLQGGQLVQGGGRYLRQRVIIEPQVTERAQAGETSGGNAGDVVSIQAAAERLKYSVVGKILNVLFQHESKMITKVSQL